jgi:ubiquinone/menaquinone biosynthesis C-methylase UbiE
MPLQKDPEGNETHYLNLNAVFTNQRVLEIGSGEGRLTWRYAHSARLVTGIDLDADALKVARVDRPADLDKTVSFASANSLDLPFRHAQFDTAILSWSF